MVFRQCPDSSSKNDLLAYIQRIALYSHQLTITARVKADVQMISGELVVSGVSVYLIAVISDVLRLFLFVNLFNFAVQRFRQFPLAKSIQIFSLRLQTYVRVLNILPRLCQRVKSSFPCRRRFMNRLPEICDKLRSHR